ncbi:MAG: 16S rRNA (guanine(527)-N(7))-methyltransferase RsmG [Nitrospiria bacterium]
MNPEHLNKSNRESSGVEDPTALLISGCSELGIRLSTRQVNQLMRYLSELQKWNQKINLTALRQNKDIIIKHFIDSLTPLVFLQAEAHSKWIDVGSGAGFPGLVLKIACPQVEMTLVEPSAKKAAFLHHLIGLFEMRYVSIINQRIEHWLQRSEVELFDLVMTRALSPEHVLNVSHRLLSKNGKILIFQGQENRQVTMNRLKDYPLLTLERIAPLRLPWSKARRTLILIRIKE